MSVTATVEVALTTTPWPSYPAPVNTPGTSATVPDTQAASEQAVDNPSPEEELAAKLVSEPKPRRHMSRKAAAIVAATATLVVLVVTLWNSFFLVNTGEVAIVSFGGNIDAYNSGAHFKAPWQSVDRFPTSFQSSTWSYMPSFNNGDNGSIITTTRDSVWVHADLQVTYRLRNLDQIVAIWQNYGSQDVLRTQVDRTIEHATQTALQGFTATEIWHRDARIEQAVRTQVGTDLKARFGIELGGVVSMNCAFNEEVTRALNAQASVTSAKG